MDANWRLKRLVAHKALVEKRTERNNGLAARARGLGIAHTQRQVRKAGQGRGKLLREIYEAEAARA